MIQNLVFLTGASRGIGLALAHEVPFRDAYVYDISRQGSYDYDHIAADLADPDSWSTIGDFFAREMRDFRGERVVFVHCAGSIEPIGFAGEVDAELYGSNVLLNSAAPQVLGESFLAASRLTGAQCHLIMISSGAAARVYQGWSSYGAGKAAVDQWVRVAGAEQSRRGNHCRVLAVRPGVVATAMQEEIRRTSPDLFPDVGRFVDLHESGELRRPMQVAREIWALLDRDLENGAVVDLRDLED
jgi:NAD(P)-dependent dehydrogenase (short-subunit alcohol dehydrogenase family)